MHCKARLLIKVRLSTGFNLITRFVEHLFIIPRRVFLLTKLFHAASNSNTYFQGILFAESRRRRFLDIKFSQRSGDTFVVFRVSIEFLIRSAN